MTDKNLTKESSSLMKSSHNNLDAGNNSAQGQGPQEQLMVPNNETMGKFEPGDTTLRICGWCQYSGSGTMYGHCMAKGKCGLIPLPQSDFGLMPPIVIESGGDLKKSKEMKALLKAYEEADKLDKGAIRQFNQNKLVLNKIIKTVTAAMDEDITNIDTPVLWNTECLLVRALGNDDFKDVLISRMDSWIGHIENRIDDRHEIMSKIENQKRELSAYN